MSIIDALLLGLLQGVTEFIPVSSSGHLILLDEYTDVSSSFSFDVLVNIGTLAALIIYFRGRLIELWRQLWGGQDKKLLKNVIISTVPAVIVGGLFADLFASDDVRNRSIVIIMLLSIGIFMVVADRWLKGNKTIERLAGREAFGVGLGQALALIPGTSRSGATILAGRASGLSYAQAAEYSFLIAIPILSGAIVRSLFQTETNTLLSSEPAAVTIGVLAAFLSGWLAIDFMLKILRRRGLMMFGVYRILLALTLLLVGS